jgi:hypothetical protein
MAALAIPLILAAAPLLQPLISSLIIHVERLFGAGTGPVKFANVVSATVQTAADLSTAGKLPGLLTAETIAMMVETEVQSLKASGVLTPANAALIVSQPITTSTPGQQLHITGGSLTLG